MYFIQVMLTCRLRHELPDAIVQSAVNYQIRAIGGASAFIPDRRPFSKSCRSIEIDVIVVVHGGLQTLSHSLAGFADGGRENPFLAHIERASARFTFPEVLGLAQRRSADLLANDVPRGNGWKKPSVEFHQDGTRLSVLLSARRRSSSPSTELPCLPATVGATPFGQGKS